MKVASVVAAVLLLCIAFPGSIHAKKYCVGKDGKHYLRGEHYEDKKGEKCIRYTCVRKGKKLEMNKKKISCDEPPPNLTANVTALEASIKSLQTGVLSLQTSVESVLETVTALQFRSSQLETNVTTNIDAINIIKDDISTNVATLATKCDASSCSSLQTTATDIESCLSDTTSSTCPPPPSGKTSMVGGISANTAALADKCDASTCSDIQTTVENLEMNVTTNKDSININKDDISTNFASLATKCDASSCANLQTSASDIESCLADITSSVCPSPSSGKTSMAGGISSNTAALAVLLLHTDSTFLYYKVKVPESTNMTSASVLNTCTTYGMQPQCYGGSYADSKCVLAPNNGLGYSNSNSVEMAKILCNGEARPDKCASTINIFWYMDNWRSGSSCGALADRWCATGKDYTSTSDLPFFAACLKPI